MVNFLVLTLQPCAADFRFSLQQILELLGRLYLIWCFIVATI